MGGQQDAPLIDRLPICIGDITFKYETNAVAHDAHSYAILKKLDPSAGGVNFGGQMKISQGQLVQLIGPHGEGKTTLLKLIGGVLMPKLSQELLDSPEPFFFVPPHLNMIYVPSQPIFFRACLLDNLTLGVKPGSPDGFIVRVAKVCQHLGLTECLKGFPLDSDVEHDWSLVLSHT